MKYPAAPLLERITYALVQPIAWLLWLHYKHRAASINRWWGEAFRWNEDDCAVLDFACNMEDVDAERDEELEDAYNLYVDMCRPLGIVPKDFIDSNKE